MLPTAPSPWGDHTLPAVQMSSFPGRTYKYYQHQPLFPFGFGLSLTTFELSVSQVSRGFDNSHTVECAVRNTGALDGDEVVMVFHRAGPDVRSRIGTAHPVPAKVSGRLHILCGRFDWDVPICCVFWSCNNGVETPGGKALVGFERVRVAAGQSVSVRFELGSPELELVNATGGRQLYPGTHSWLFSRGHGHDGVVNVTVVS
jgi:hypothetical protein